MITIILSRLWPIATRHDDHDQPIIDLVQVPVGGSIPEQDHGMQQSTGVIIEGYGVHGISAMVHVHISNDFNQMKFD